MALNTRIRGAQIKLDDVSLDVATDSFAFYDVSDGVIKRDLISDFVTAIAGDGLSASAGVLAVDVADLDIMGLTPGSILGTEDIWIPYVDGETTGLPIYRFNMSAFVTSLIGDGLVASVSAIAVQAEDGSILVGGSGIKVGLIDGNHIDASGTPGQVLTLGTGNTVTWEDPASVAEDYIQEAEIVTENHSADILETGFAGIVELGFAPVLGSVQVFLNGLLQEEGSGKDYTIGGTGNKIVTFDTAPVIDDIVIIHYIKN